MATTTDSELQQLFCSPGAELEPDVLAELESIMRLHSIDGQELWYKWESYSMKMGTDDVKLNIDTARALKNDVQDSLERENRSKAHVLQSNKRAVATPRHTANNGDVFGMLDGLTPNTPKTGSASRTNGLNKRKAFNTETPTTARIKAEPASSPPDFKAPKGPGKEAGQSVPVAFNDRPNPGQTIEVLNDHLQPFEPPIAPYPQSRIKLTANSDIKKLSYKPLAMKSSEVSETLDDRIDTFMNLIQEHHKLEDTAFGSAASKSTNEIVAVGRIASDSLQGKLTASSLVLETSRRMGGGYRIPLKVGSLTGYQFFPGQIVAVKGINASGDDFIVSEVLEAPLLPSAASAPATLDAHLQRLTGGPDAMPSDESPAPLSIILGAGPYTADDNLDFEPLHALCSQAADTYADALVLTGPFLDIDHPLVASGDFDLPDAALADPDRVSLSTVFKHLISPAFTQLTISNPSITILLVPSVKDAISKHVSWPQEPLPRRDLGLPKAVKMLGNPMTLSLNEAVVGISAQDILTELRLEEVTGGPAPPDASLLSRLPKYLITQRNFFPLFPPADRDRMPRTGTVEGVPAGAMLDPSYLELGETLKVRPDVLVVPSALPAFAKIVESVIVINPGYVSKRRGAGTYARLTIYPPAVSDEERNSGMMVGHKVFERARVDVVRI